MLQRQFQGMKEPRTGSGISNEDPGDLKVVHNNACDKSDRGNWFN